MGSKAVEQYKSIIIIIIIGCIYLLFISIKIQEVVTVIKSNKQLQPMNNQSLLSISMTPSTSIFVIEVLVHLG